MCCKVYTFSEQAVFFNKFTQDIFARVQVSSDILKSKIIHHENSGTAFNDIGMKASVHASKFPDYSADLWC